MTRGILIAGNESSLFSAMLAEAAKRVEAFASAVIPNRFLSPESRPPQTEASSGGATPLSWNPSSPISARTLVLAAENRLKQINNAIIVCSPPAVYKTPEALTPEEVEILVNDHIKGWFLLVRELVVYFLRSGTGSLSLVVPESGAGAKDIWDRGDHRKNSQIDILGASASSSFRAFAQAVISSSSGKLFETMGFTSAEAGAEAEFAAWIFRIVDEGTPKNSGRWHKFSKLKFFR